MFERHQAALSTSVEPQDGSSVTLFLSEKFKFLLFLLGLSFVIKRLITNFSGYCVLFMTFVCVMLLLTQ